MITRFSDQYEVWMIFMDKLDYGVIGLYILLIGIISIITYRPGWHGMFKASYKARWWVPGLSLAMMIMSTDGPQLITGIVLNQGLWGLWLLWIGLLTVGVVPILFAPLWSNLGFITDNQFLLFRFSGKSAKVLFNFRAIYLGVIIVPFLLSFQLIAFKNVMMIYFGLSSSVALYFTGSILAFFALKNSFDHKLKIDMVHAIIYFSSLIIGATVLLQIGGGWTNILESFDRLYPTKLNLLPNFSNNTFRSEFFTYLFILWWSAQMFDGSGGEMQRFVAIKGRFNVIKTSLAPILLKQVFFILVLIIVIAGMVIDFSNLKNTNGEASFISFFTGHLPSGYKGLALVGFFVAFITTAEALLNWGASLLVVDVYKKNINDKTNKHYVISSLVVMVAMVLQASLFAFYNQSLYGMLQFFLSISAGVAPVFILRWVWLRINAWSQLSAMIGSLIYSYLFQFIPIDWMELLGLYDKTARLLFVTIFTTTTWLLITFLTPKDSKESLLKFRIKVPLKSFSGANVFFAFSIGIIAILVMVLSVKLLISF